jgi:UDP-N-acetylmuramoyl-tripeptide--D-alanyl-D-alanine ligase
MKPLTLEETITAMQAAVSHSRPLGSVQRVIIDSRQVQPGDLFVAIAGQRFDGHDFVHQALQAGAVAAVVRDDYESAGLSDDGLLVRVDDPVTAMGRLGRYYRRTVLSGAVTVIAVTGSNGKTTTKMMIAHLLNGRWQGKAAVKNFNNEIGVPLTLLSADKGDKFLVCELGTNALGEIPHLATMVEPQIAVITGVSEAHLAGLGNLEKITDEKLALLKHMRTDGCAFVNFDHEIIRYKMEKDPELKKRKFVSFGQWPEADLRLTGIESVPSPDPQNNPFGGIEFELNNRFRYRLNVPGRHNAFNALAAIGVARRFGMDPEEVADRLATFSMPPMRLNCEQIGSIRLINDSYNANPASLAAAVDTLIDIPTQGRRIMVVGDMRELGAESDRLHEEAGQRLGASGVDVILAVGEHAQRICDSAQKNRQEQLDCRFFGSTDEAGRILPNLLQPGDTIMLKGSRAMALEKLASVIRDWAVNRKDRDSAA